MLEEIKNLLAESEEKRKKLAERAKESDDIKEVRSINNEIADLNETIYRLRKTIDKAESEAAKKEEAEERTAQNEEIEAEERGKQPTGEERAIGSFYISKGANSEEERAAKEKEEAEKRGKDLKEKRAVTVTTEGVILPKHQASDIKSTFNEVSTLIDRVTHLPLNGGESFEQPYIAGYATGGYTAEGTTYSEGDAIFGKARINKTKITNYSQISEELEKLPNANYAGVVTSGVRIAIRKKLSREILIGDGTAGHLVGIFDDGATAIDPSTDKIITKIDNTTLKIIVYSYGGDEDVEDAAVLTLNKKDLMEFALLKTTDGKDYHNIVTNGNTGTIDGIPFVINSACKAINDPETVEGDYAMAYGPLSNYTFATFSDLEVKRSEDVKFLEGMIVNRGSIFSGGNVTSKNGFLRVKRGPVA